jgi:hypothetical protein
LGSLSANSLPKRINEAMLANVVKEINALIKKSTGHECQNGSLCHYWKDILELSFHSTKENAVPI